MPPSINPLPILRTCVIRPRHFIPRNSVIGIKRPASGTPSRGYADPANRNDKLPKAPAGEQGPNMAQQEHVSEEAAKMAKIKGEQGPDIEGQGTPVQDIIQNEKDVQKKAPKVMKESIKDGSVPSGSRSFSTSTRRRADIETASSSVAAPLPPSMLLTSAQDPSTTSILEAGENPGHKFPLPTLPLPDNAHKAHRQEEIVEYLTNLMMRDGKKAQAQRAMAVVLSYLRTAPAPKYSPARPLLPGAPPASHLPLNPVLYLTLAVDSVAPLMRLRSQRGAAGGGVALQIPVPLTLRQRRRQSFMWILDAVSKRKNMGSGRDTFAHRVAQELISIVEGRSGVWDRRHAVHRLGTTARSNINYGSRGNRRM